MLTSLLDKLSCRLPLSHDDRSALLDLPFTSDTKAPNAFLAREGIRSGSFFVIQSGYAISSRLTRAGARQIVAIHMPGDIIGFGNFSETDADCSVQTVTSCQIAYAPVKALIGLALRSPAIMQALWIDREVECSILREWIVNIGRRDGTTRVAHLICELAARTQIIGLGDSRSFPWVFTQDQVADAVGLTVVHVNRMLRRLRDQGLIDLASREMIVSDCAALKAKADFKEAYLKLPPTASALD
jgi:CRP-like cAMP-binding protein